MVAPGALPRPRDRCSRRARRPAAAATSATSVSRRSRRNGAVSQSIVQTSDSGPSARHLPRDRAPPRRGSRCRGRGTCRARRRTGTAPASRPRSSRGTRGRRSPSRGGAPGGARPHGAWNSTSTPLARSTSACTSAPLVGQHRQRQVVARDGERAPAADGVLGDHSSGIVSRMNQFAVSPQSTVRLMPVMPEASSEARKAKPAAISDGFTRRRIGTRAKLPFR